jgi:hypothetical protein
MVHLGQERKRDIVEKSEKNTADAVEASRKIRPL